MKVKPGVIVFEGCHFWLTATSSPFSCTQLYVYKHPLQRYSLNIWTSACLFYGPPTKSICLRTIQKSMFRCASYEIVCLCLRLETDFGCNPKIPPRLQLKTQPVEALVGKASSARVKLCGGMRQ